ncbi:MAG: DUF5522 domain-containing protein [Actinomycetes bacterium]|jgi:hypothetical protein
MSQRANRDLHQPHPDRLALDHPLRERILAAHDAALEHGDDGYLDPGTGWWVFSAGYLADRETCCNSGCRHCPYQD